MTGSPATSTQAEGTEIPSAWGDKELAIYESLTRQSVPALLLKRARETPDAVAYRYKDLGIWKELTWAGLWERAEAIAMGLAELGLRRGDRMAVMADPCIEWPLSDFAGLGLGAIVYGIYPTSSPQELHYQLDHGGARFFVAENQEYVDKILAVVDQLPRIERIIVADTRAIWAYKDERLISFAEVEELGREAARHRPGWFESSVRAVDVDDPAAIVYTSGTSGNPKGATVSHRAMCAFSCSQLPFPQVRDKPNRTVSALPLAHLLERSMTVVVPLISNTIVHIGESGADPAETLTEVAPTTHVTVPRNWEKLASRVLVMVETSSPFKQWVFRTATKIARRHIEARWEGKVPLWLRAAYRVAWLAAFRSVLEKTGMLKLRLGVTSAAPMPPEVMTLWQMWGIDLREGYGQTEVGWISIQDRPFPRPGTVGKPFPWMTVKLGRDNEILVRPRAPFLGYWRDPEASEPLVGPKLAPTGDVGIRAENGDLKIIDRKKDIVITSGGKNLSPLQIENAIKGSPYISEAIVFADQRKYPTALIEIDFDTVSEWARSRGVIYTGFTSLARHPEVRKLIDGEIAKANQQLARVEQVKRFTILDQEFDPEAEDDPVTPTRKVRRRQMAERFKAEIEAMYEADRDRERIGEVVGVGGTERRAA